MKPIQVPYFPFMGAVTLAALSVGKFSETVSTTTALSVLLPVATVLYTLYYSWIYPFYVSPLRHIPTVPGFPLWGQFFTIITTECGVAARDWHAQYGTVVRYFFPFGSERLSVVDDDAIKQMTVRNPYNFPKPERARQWMIPILGEGVLLAEGHTHVVQRKALTPAFSITSIRSLMPVFWAKSLHMAKLWEDDMKAEGAKSKCFEVLEWLNRTTLDIIGKAGLGTDIDSLDNPETPLRDAYRRCFDFDLEARIINGLAAFTPLIRLLPARANRDIQIARNIILSRAQQIIQEKQKPGEAAEVARHKDIIGLIVKDNMTASKEDTLSLETMRNQVMTFLGAGHDTTATSVAWTLLMLAKHPDIQSKLREEVREKMPFLFDDATRNIEDTIEKADVDLLPYLEDVCKESLRYIPSIPMTVRKTIEDDTLAGHYIPGGTTVYLMANTINRLPMYWGDTADKFDPSRWKNLPETYTTNAFMTFLQGPRGCVGRKFAEVEMKTILCSLLSKFNFERDGSVQDPEELKMWRLVLRPRDGVSLKVTPLAA
ncbi:cytochrome P450 monooxygenase [Exophiala viscosa]|uniref:Cytochrome P450 monooxygenase n=1 Tax=Exophiala viscosa TaxID=2486360 RepID=A0AAN6IEZ9_9EURO|nr:cytochrome P450 monooxygenase [Exophiala viscosa]